MSLELPPSRMVAQVSRNIRDLNFRSATRQWIGERLNEAHRTMMDRVRDVNYNAFMDTATINVVIGQEEYDLPLNCPPDGVREVLPLLTVYQRSRPYVRWRDREMVVSGSTKTFTVRHNGQRLVLLLKPTPAEAETVTVWYQRDSVEMQYGTPVSLSGTTIRLAAAPTMGNPYLQANYPVGARVLISAGSALGDVRRITAFNQHTRRATVDSAFSATGASTATYEIVPDWLDDSAADYMILDATVAFFEREEDDPGDFLRRRDTKLKSIVQKWLKPQKFEPVRMRLDREGNGMNLRSFPPDVHLPRR